MLLTCKAVFLRIATLVAVCSYTAHGAAPINWTANYPPCNRHEELLNREHMNLGVRLAKVNSVLAEEFSRAMDAWAAVLDFDWRPDESQNCAIQVIEGEKQLFDSDAMAARSQLPDRLNFQGWIA